MKVVFEVTNHIFIAAPVLGELYVGPDGFNRTSPAEIKAARAALVASVEQGDRKVE